MQEILDQILGYLKGIWNKRWYGMFIAWIICLIGWGYVYKMPDQYQSKAKIYIDTQTLLRPLLRGLALETNVQQEINLMVKTLLTRPNVEKIIRLSDLDLEVTNERDFDKLVSELQNNIRFGKGQRSQVNLYNLSYSNKNAKVAQKVLESVITVFVENSIGRNKQDSQSAKTFINRQIEEYEKRLLEAENRLKVFKQNNVGKLPGSGGGYYSKMEATKSTLAQTKLELREAIKERTALQKDINELIQSIKLSANSNNSTASLRTSFDARIEKLSSELDTMLLKYTEQHPDIRGTRRILEDLQKQRLAEIKTLRDSLSSQGSGMENNSLYQDLKINLTNTNSQIGALKVRVEEYTKRYDELSRLVDEVPEIEAQFTALNRDYEITKDKYADLLSRRESATISESVNKTTDGVQFNVVEPPRVGLKPVGPNRILLSSMALMLGLAAGLAISFGLSQLRPVFHTPKDLENLFALPILGSVSAVTSPGQHRRRMLLVLTYLSLFITLLMLYAALMAWYMDGFWKMINSAKSLITSLI